MNLTDSCFLQTVSFPQLRDLQAGQRRDLSPKACGHLLHSLLDTLLLLPFFLWTVTDTRGSPRRRRSLD